MHRVTLVRTDQGTLVFDCDGDVSVLRAAHRAGYQLTCGCLQGRCAVCRARLLSGSVRSLRPASPCSARDPAEMGDGSILLCSVTPTADIRAQPASPWLRLAAHKNRSDLRFVGTDPMA